MDTEIRLKAANDLLAPWATATNTPEPDRLDIYVETVNLLNWLFPRRYPGDLALACSLL